MCVYIIVRYDCPCWKEISHEYKMYVSILLWDMSVHVGKRYISNVCPYYCEIWVSMLERDISAMCVHIIGRYECPCWKEIYHQYVSILLWDMSVHVGKRYISNVCPYYREIWVSMLERDISPICVHIIEIWVSMFEGDISPMCVYKILVSGYLEYRCLCIWYECLCKIWESI